MRASRLRPSRGWILSSCVLSAGLVFAASLVAPVSAQTKKPSPKTGKPAVKAETNPVKPVPKSKGSASTNESPAVIPGLPPNAPQGVRESFEKQLQGQLDERDARRKRAAKEAVSWLQRADKAQDDEAKAAALVMAGRSQVDALQLAEATKTFSRVIALTDTGVSPVTVKPATVASPPVAETKPSSLPNAAGSIPTPNAAAPTPPDKSAGNILPSAWELEARLFLFDLALEHELNPVRAEEVLRSVAAWLKTVPRPATALKRTVVSLAVAPLALNAPLPLQSLGPKRGDGAVSVTGAGTVKETPPDATSTTRTKTANARGTTATVADADPPRDVRRIAADVRLRLGLLSAMRGDLVRGKIEFQQAETLGFDANAALAVFANRVLTGQRVPPLPDPVKNGPAPSASLIRLALLINETGEHDRALRLWDALLRQKDEAISHPQRSYAHLQRGLARSELSNPLEWKPTRTAADYAAVANLYPDAEWLDDALFYHANLEWNVNRNAEAAVALWTRLRDQHPTSEFAARAAYHIGVAHESAKQWELAKTAYDDARQKFPDSPHNKTIDQHLTKVTKELARLKPKPGG